MRVLVVDDSDAFRDALEQIVVAAGLEVAGTASSGEEAIRLFEELGPDALVIDVRLPRMSGCEVADRVRAVSADVPVVMVSATDSSQGRSVLPKRSLTPERLRAALGLGRSPG